MVLEIHPAFRPCCICHALALRVTTRPAAGAGGACPDSCVRPSGLPHVPSVRQADPAAGLLRLHNLLHAARSLWPVVRSRMPCVRAYMHASGLGARARAWAADPTAGLPRLPTPCCCQVALDDGEDVALAFDGGRSITLTGAPVGPGREGAVGQGVSPRGGRRVVGVTRNGGRCRIGRRGGMAVGALKRSCYGVLVGGCGRSVCGWYLHACPRQRSGPFYGSRVLPCPVCCLGMKPPGRSTVSW